MLGQRRHGTDGAADQLAPAIRTAVVQDPFSARLTERALEGADARLRRVRRKIPVTAFAIRPQLEHGSSTKLLSTRRARIADIRVYPAGCPRRQVYSTRREHRHDIDGETCHAGHGPGPAQRRGGHSSLVLL